jgi:hypothetical protein
MVVVEEKAKAPLEPPPRELSPLRVLMLVVVLCAVGFGVWQLASKSTPAADAKSGEVPVYSPYVDVTNTPTYPFQLPSANPVSSVYLSFVVSDTEEPCTPSWGTFYTLDSAEQFCRDRLPKFLQWFERIVVRNPGGPRYLVGGKLSYADLSLFQLIEGLSYAFPKATQRVLRHTPSIVQLRDRVAALPRVAAYLGSDRRIPFNEEGIFRRYPELDIG